MRMLEKTKKFDLADNNLSILSEKPVRNSSSIRDLSFDVEKHQDALAIALNGVTNGLQSIGMNSKNGYLKSVEKVHSNNKYNLRSRQDTPDVNSKV